MSAPAATGATQTLAAPPRQSSGDTLVHELLQIGSRTAVLPVIHGSGQWAVEVRRLMLQEHFDCLAVPLPPSFQADVEAGIELLPTVTMVIQPEPPDYAPDNSWAESAAAPEAGISHRVSYVPIDPCQPVIAGLRLALGEHVAREFIDLETAAFQPFTRPLPDPYALRKVSATRFAAAILPFVARPAEPQVRDRIRHMASRLRELESRYRRTLLVCSILEWPWIREAFAEAAEPLRDDDFVAGTQLCQPDARTLLFMLGELPFIAGLYERARAELEDDEQLPVDGVKELLIAARGAYRRECKRRARLLTPQRIACCLKYIRNLTLLGRRLTPDLYSIVTAAKQVAGDGFAMHVAELSREYPYAGALPLPRVALGVDRLRLTTGEIATAVNRLAGPPLAWRSCVLRRRPDRTQQQKWQMTWNPLAQCSWPPEDQRIESFRSHVTDRAKALMGADLARTEKFTTSIKDGIDIRDTLRHWHTGDIYVRVLPPSRGKLDAVVMLFDSPADPRRYPWRTTWFAEHQNESTLAFFATDYLQQIVGPGIGSATYGGALFLFPPVSFPDIWADEGLDFAETLEERLLAAACRHSRCARIALLSAYPPGAGWRRLARRFRKKWVHIPLGQFSAQTLEQLRVVHVLNGREVRSYAAQFIRHG